MNSVEEEVEAWITRQPIWVQMAVKSISAGEKVDILRLAWACLRAVRGKVQVSPPAQSGTLVAGARQASIILKSMGEILGINRLSPRSTLSFGQSNLSLVYGLNGAGKSGYVRILKQISKPGNAQPLMGNVYAPVPGPQSCSVSYLVDGVLKTKRWTSEGGPIPELKAVDVFDSAIGDVYLSSENEVSYEPAILTLFTKLIDLSSEVAAKLDGYKKQLSTLPISSDLALSGIYQEILSLVGRDEFKRRIGGLSWAESDEARLETLRGRLQEKTPFERAKALSATKSFLDKLIADIKSKTEMLSAGSFNRFQALKTTMAVKRNAANLAANQLFSDMAQLDGVGSAVWRELWRAAKAYAAEKAYPGKIYPHDDPEMRCVLCQQVLDDDGRKRMKAFEDFVKGKAQKELDDAISANNAFLASLPVAEDAETFDKTLMSAGIVEEGEKKLLVSFNDSVGERRTAFDACVSEVELSKLVDVGDWIEKATLRSCELSKQCEALMSDAQSGVEGRERLKTEIRELEARKWLVENLTTLKWRHAYVRLNAEIEKAKKLLSTAELSSKKSELTGRIVTEAYIARFESELKTLSGGRIKVSLAKSRVAKGHVLHRISLNVEHAVRVRDILSEGECRVVSLAAFLADSEGNRVSAPFVFDDPISSLDQPYEEAVAKRLIELAKTRQVIVFTHRLSMIGTILHFTKREKVEKVGVSCEAIR